MYEVNVILRKELRDALRGRWLLAFAATFAVLALTLSLVQGRSGDLGDQGFNKTTAGLINLCLLLVPLLALILGAGGIAGERERGTFAMLLSQPISPAQLVLGKFLGLVIAVWVAIALGFGGAGLVMALFSPITDVNHYFFFVGLSAVLAAAMLSLGLFISVFSDSRLKALSIAVVIWFLLVLLYDLGAVGLALSVSSSGRSLLLVVLGNPIECVRILAIMSLESDLDTLGPLGSYVSNEVGRGAGILLLSTALAAWVIVPLLATLRIAGNRDA